MADSPVKTLQAEIFTAKSMKSSAHNAIETYYALILQREAEIAQLDDRIAAYEAAVAALAG